MNKRTIIYILSVVVLIAIVCLTTNLLSSNNKVAQSQNSQPTQVQNKTPIEKADKVEVFLFHGTQRCATCIAIGKLAGETINEYFQPELREGRIEFKEINIDLPENQALAEKFQASGSALFINSIIKGKDHIEQDAKVWRLTQDEAQFKSYLKNKLDNLLGKTI